MDEGTLALHIKAPSPGTDLTSLPNKKPSRKRKAPKCISTESDSDSSTSSISAAIAAGTQATAAASGAAATRWRRPRRTLPDLGIIAGSLQHAAGAAQREGCLRRTRSQARALTQKSQLQAGAAGVEGTRGRVRSIAEAAAVGVAGGPSAAREEAPGQGAAEGNAHHPYKGVSWTEIEPSLWQRHPSKLLADPARDPSSYVTRLLPPRQKLADAGIEIKHGSVVELEVKVPQWAEQQGREASSTAGRAAVAAGVRVGEQGTDRSANAPPAAKGEVSGLLAGVQAKGVAEVFHDNATAAGGATEENCRVMHPLPTCASSIDRLVHRFTGKLGCWRG